MRTRIDRARSSSRELRTDSPTLRLGETSALWSGSISGG